MRLATRPRGCQLYYDAIIALLPPERAQEYYYNNTETTLLGGLVAVNGTAKLVLEVLE